MKNLKLVVLLAIIFIVASCGKNFVLDTTFEVTPFIQEDQNGEEYITFNIRGYYFYADSTYFHEVNYEDAVAATIRYKTGQVLSYNGVAERDENGTLYFRNLTQSEVILVLVNEENEVFCWRQLYLEPGQDYIITRIRFRLWRSGLEYKEAGWTVKIPVSDEEEEEENEGGSENEEGDESGEQEQ